MYQEFNGFRFNLDRTTGYFHGWVNGVNYLMHRYIWEFYNGEIPKGYHVHHIDGDKSNNKIENLECIIGSSHLSSHMNKRDKQELRNRMSVAQEYAKLWHKSEEGHVWHSKHAKEIMEVQLKIKSKNICENCGKEFEIYDFKKKQSRFCCNACKSAYRRKNHIDDEKRICEVCGKEFYVNKYAKSKTCSRSCANVMRAKTMKEQKGR